MSYKVTFITDWKEMEGARRRGYVIPGKRDVLGGAVRAKWKARGAVPPRPSDG